MKSITLFIVCLPFLILDAMPAEAAAKSGSIFSIGFFALIAAVIVLTAVLKKFMG